MNPLRLCLVGGNMGPDLFVICEILGKEETISRIKSAVAKIVWTLIILILWGTMIFEFLQLKHLSYLFIHENLKFNFNFSSKKLYLPIHRNLRRKFYNVWRFFSQGFTCCENLTIHSGIKCLSIKIRVRLNAEFLYKLNCRKIHREKQPIWGNYWGQTIDFRIRAQ